MCPEVLQAEFSLVSQFFCHIYMAKGCDVVSGYGRLQDNDYSRRAGSAYPRPVRSCEQGNKRDSTLPNLDRPRLISGCSDDAAVSGPAGQFGSVG